VGGFGTMWWVRECTSLLNTYHHCFSAHEFHYFSSFFGHLICGC
jgi:hypothetical protein